MSTPSPPPPSSLPTATTPPLKRDLTSARSLKQLSLFAAGSIFFLFSLRTTRRALLRKRFVAPPAPTTPTPLSQNPSLNLKNTLAEPSASQVPPPNVNAGLDAAEALTLATLNVTSLMMAATGLALWKFDISSMDDLRRVVRGEMGLEDDSGLSVEEEFEEWLASTLERKRRREDGDTGVEKTEGVSARGGGGMSMGERQRGSERGNGKKTELLGNDGRLRERGLGRGTSIADEEEVKKRWRMELEAEFARERKGRR